jgi:uncharacterized ParB-like nuclease family protein
LEQLEAREQFDVARFRAFRRAMRAALAGRARRLIPLDQILEAAGFEGKSYGGVQEIPLDRVVGPAHAARTHDFDAAFLPTTRRLRHRWAGIYAAQLTGAEIPPIDVYKMDDRYYVIDGHHRVSVFRSLGHETIKARVTDVRTRVPLAPDVDRAELLRAAEYARFLETTQLDRVRPEARLEVSQLGRYDEILKHILGHRYFLGLERGREVPMAEAASSWYDSVYLPITAVISRHDVHSQLRGWTVTDLYVEITRRWLASSEAGGDAGPHAAVHGLLDDISRHWWRRRRSPIRLG